LAIFVVKADGRRQPFDKEKIVRTCLRMGASREIAEKIARIIESKAYNGMETREILKTIFRLLSRYKPAVKHIVDLRKSLSLMDPRDFECFVQILLGEHGYDVTPNQIICGKCVEHEVDAVARKKGKTYIVEVKRHSNYHTPTGLDVSRIARAVLEDVTEGFKLGLHDLKIDGAMIVCNTKLSNHAKRYAKCRGIHHIGWRTPPNHDLRVMIEEKKLYPITYLKGLDAATKEKLASAGIILLKQLTAKPLKELEMETGIRRETLRLIVKRAKTVLSER